MKMYLSCTATADVKVHGLHLIRSNVEKQLVEASRSTMFEDSSRGCVCFVQFERGNMVDVAKLSRSTG